VDAFLAANKLEEEVEDLNEAFKEGDKIAGFVVEFDEPSKTIEISQKEGEMKKSQAKLRSKSDSKVC
jgi:small subunit ribosomal protein S1